MVFNPAAVQYADFNIGVENVDPIKVVVQYTDFNIGLQPVDERDDVEYTDFNVGLEPKPHYGSEYADFNIYTETGQYHRGVYVEFDVDPSYVPTPHIWYVRPQVGREGLLFNIIGMGFGITQDEFDGKVMLGALEAPITQWTVIPAQTTRALRFSGYATTDDDFEGNWVPFFTPRASTYNSTINSVVLQTGDVIEFDYINRSSVAPLPNEIRVIPFFAKLNSAATSITPWTTAPTMAQLLDQNGLAWHAQVPSAVGERVHRRFVVPSAFNGIRAGHWGVGLYGESTMGRGARTADFARFVVRDAGGTPKLWVTLDDDGAAVYGYSFTGLGWPESSSPTDTQVNYAAVGFVNSPLLPNFIDYGATNVEHEWLIAIVPDDAESGMVKVVLEDV